MADTRVEDLDESTTGLELVGLDDGDVDNLEARSVLGDGGTLGLGDSLGSDGNHCCCLFWLVVREVESLCREWG